MKKNGFLNSFENKKTSFFKLIFLLTQENRVQFGIFVFLIIFNSLLISINAYVINLTIEQIVYDFSSNTLERNNHHLDWWVFLIISVLILFGMAAGAFTKEYLGTIIAIKIEIQLRQIVLEKLLKQDISYYYDKKIGDVMTKVVGDSNVIGNEINGLFSAIIQAPIVMVFSSIVLIMIDIPMGVAAVGMIYLLSIFLVLITLKYKKRTVVVRTTVSDINGDVIDRIGAIRLIKSLATREYELERTKEIHKPYLSNFKPLAKTGGLLLQTLIVCDAIVNVFTIAVGVIWYAYIGEDINIFIIKLIPIVSGLTQLTRPLWQISGIIPGIARAGASTEKIMEIVSSEIILDDNFDTGKALDGSINKIEFINVDFKYPKKEEWILNNINLTLEKGKKYAFVGETGSGKSTIAKLILRFYDKTSGKILVNGFGIEELNLKNYLQKVGYVEQEPQIIFGNVYDNVRYGSFDATDKEVENACKQSKMHEVVMSWKDKYETILGEKGTLVSGGQKQRLVLARLILKNPEIIVLDEATSALDNIVEKEIQIELEKLMENKTTVVIAHRLSTIKNVDKIFVLAPSKGIIQSGSWDELIDIDGPFKKLYSSSL